MYKIQIIPRTLHFKQPAGTSRGVYTTRKVWYIRIEDRNAGRFGIGECAPLPALSCDDLPEIQQLVDEIQDAVRIVLYVKQSPLRIGFMFLFQKFAQRSGDKGERRAYFVGDVDEDLELHLSDFLFPFPAIGKEQQVACTYCQ